jgi:hypothetical protein
MKDFMTKNLGKFLGCKTPQKKVMPKISSGKQITLTPALFKRKAFEDKELK